MPLRILIFLFALIFVQISSPAFAKRLALVIGNDNYDNVSRLEKARNDAQAVASALKSVGFDVTVRLDTRSRAMNFAVFGDFVSKIRSGDEVVFYFAGHGVEIRGRNYLLPTDIPAAKPGNERIVTKEGFAVDEIIRAIEEKGSRVAILILDACRDNPFPKKGTRSLGNSRGLADMPNTPKGTFVMYSAGSRQTALDRLSDGDANPNSVYTRKLIPLLRSPGLPITRMAKRLRSEVEELAKTVSHDQYPAYYDQIKGDFFFVPGNPSSNSLSNPFMAPPKNSAQNAAPRLSSEELLWREIQNSKRPDDFKLYLKEYPSGRHAALAKLKLQRLTPTTAHLQNPARIPQNNNPPTEKRVQYHFVGPVFPPDPWLSLLTRPRRGREIMRMPQGTLFRVIGRQGKWYKVKLRTGRVGWAHSGWIKCCKYISEPVSQSKVFHYVGPVYPPDPWLELRSSPGAGRSIRRMPQGTLFEVLSKRGVWYNVQLRDGTEGWAHSKWIRCCKTVR